MQNDCFLVFTTIDSLENAKTIVEILLNSQLSKCIQYFEINSAYIWNNQIQNSKEYKIEIKCNSASLQQVIDSISVNHTYKLPEIVVLNIYSGETKYINWINSK